MKKIFFGFPLALIFFLKVISNIGVGTALAANGSEEFTSRVYFYPTPPTATRMPPKTPTPTAIDQSIPIQLTEGGCCSNPSWGVDSRWIPFLDRPDPYAPAGLYAVPVHGGEASLIIGRVGVYSRDWSRVAYNEGGRTYVERWVDRKRWEIPNEGRIVRFSPSGRMIEWEVMSRGIEFPDLRQRAIWLSKSDGTEAREVVTVNGGQFVGWLSGEQAIIVTGRLAPYGPSGIWKISIADGAGRLLLEVEHPRSPLLSPEGNWVAFYIAFDVDPEINGLWTLRTDGSQAMLHDVFGSYRWRGDGSLLVFPLRGEEASSSLWQIDASTGDQRRLLDTAATPIRITNNDWHASPDGRWIVFRSADDLNLWVVDLPEP